jgi:hypothetical protein
MTFLCQQFCHMRDRLVFFAGEEVLGDLKGETTDEADAI